MTWRAHDGNLATQHTWPHCSPAYPHSLSANAESTGDDGLVTTKSRGAQVPAPSSVFTLNPVSYHGYLLRRHAAPTATRARTTAVPTMAVAVVAVFVIAITLSLIHI